MKNVIDILGIVLPALIIILGFVRIFSGNRKNSYNGFILFIAILLLLAGIIRFIFFRNSGSGNSEPSPTGLTVSKHSDAFNGSLENIMHEYYGMTEGFVTWDTAVINTRGNDLKQKLDSLNIEELRKDTTGIYESATEPLANARMEVNTLLKAASWEPRRTSFNLLSDNLRLLLTIVKFDKSVIYWQECPMAFGDDRAGNWLSRTEEVRNPYLGTKDPKYGNSMLDCGGVKATLDFTPKDSTTTVK
jgi:hypothetical protein